MEFNVSSNSRAAIASYTEGIRQKTINGEVNAQLYLNRAAANFHLNNFSASLEDCIQALEFKPDYVKAMSRFVPTSHT